MSDTKEKCSDNWKVTGYYVPIEGDFAGNVEPIHFSDGTVAKCLTAFVPMMALAFAGVLAFGSGPARAGPPLSCVNAGELRASASAYHLTDAEVAALRQPALCVGLQSVKNGTLEWPLLVVRHQKDPDRLLWYAPHTNEEIAFDNAVAAVVRHHGTLVAVRTSTGTRCLQGQDPNRTFGTLKGGGASCAGGGCQMRSIAFHRRPAFHGGGPGLARCGSAYSRTAHQRERF